MSWHCSRELVEEYLAASSLDGKPSAQWRSMPIAQAYLCKDRMSERPIVCGGSLARVKWRSVNTVKHKFDEWLDVGEFRITRFQNGEDYWIEKEDGEGMQVFRKNFEKLIRDYFESEF